MRKPTQNISFSGRKREDWAYGVKPTYSSWDIDAYSDVRELYNLYIEETKWTWKEYLVLTITTIAILIIL